MKNHLHSVHVLAIVGIVCFFAACATNSEIKITMADASVPLSELSLIVVLNSEGNWAETMLLSIDEDLLNVPGSMFYIPSGIRTLKFRTTTSSFADSDFVFSRGVTEFVRTTYTDRSELQITDTFLPGHTYRMVIRHASNVRIEDITDSVDWLPPQISRFSPGDGVLTNFATPRGLYAIPVSNAGPYLQYNHQFNGTEALIASIHDKWAFGILINFSEKRERSFPSRVLQ